MTGTWKGQYKYDSKKAQGIIAHGYTNFTIQITSFDGKIFSGFVTDDIQTGGMEGTGKISGRLIQDQITFVKKMPKMSLLVFKTGDQINLNKKHRDIFYSGVLSNDKTIIEGTWKIKFGLLWFGLIPAIALPSKGTWFMKSLKEAGLNI